VKIFQATKSLGLWEVTHWLYPHILWVSSQLEMPTPPPRISSLRQACLLPCQTSYWFRSWKVLMLPLYAKSSTVARLCTPLQGSTICGRHFAQSKELFFIFFVLWTTLHCIFETIMIRSSVVLCRLYLFMWIIKDHIGRELLIQNVHS